MRKTISRNKGNESTRVFKEKLNDLSSPLVRKKYNLVFNTNLLGIKIN